MLFFMPTITKPRIYVQCIIFDEKCLINHPLANNACDDLGFFFFFFKPKAK